MRPFAYFPGCSMVTIAREAHEALKEIAPYLGFQLKEIDDWNCCGSSSAHTLCPPLALRLPWRILTRVPRELKEVMVMCPSCNLRLREGLFALKRAEARRHCQEFFGRLPNDGLRIVHFVELLVGLDWPKLIKRPLKGLRLAPYYGCLLFAPPELKAPGLRMGVLEELLHRLGAEVVNWRFAFQCCGTYLTVVRPDLVVATVSRMMFESQKKGIEALVTPCVMCQMNLEIRSEVPHPIPIFHLTEIIALALGEAQKAWFKRHLIDPQPLLLEKGLL